MAPRKKYQTRTFRISEEYDNILQEEAEKRGISTNNLVERILKKFTQNDRYYNETQILSIAPTTMANILETMSNNEVAQAGRKAGSIKAKENLLIRGMSLNYSSVKWFIQEIMANSAGWFVCNYSRRDDMNTFYIRHSLGQKWSIFLIAYLDAMIETILNAKATITDLKGSIILKIPPEP